MRSLESTLYVCAVMALESDQNVFLAQQRMNSFARIHQSNLGTCVCVCVHGIVYVYMPSAKLNGEMTKYMVQWLRCIRIKNTQY